MQKTKQLLTLLCLMAFITTLPGCANGGQDVRNQPAHTATPQSSTSAHTSSKQNDAPTRSTDKRLDHLTEKERAAATYGLGTGIVIGVVAVVIIIVLSFSSGGLGGAFMPAVI